MEIDRKKHCKPKTKTKPQPGSQIKRFEDCLDYQEGFNLLPALRPNEAPPGHHDQARTI